MSASPEWKGYLQVRQAHGVSLNTFNLDRWVKMLSRQLREALNVLLQLCQVLVSVIRLREGMA